MDVADDIAYGVHDLEDAIALGLINEKKFRKAVSETDCSTFLDAVKAKYPTECDNNVYDYFVNSLFGKGSERKHFISRLVHHFITNLKIETMEDFDEPLIRFRASIPKDYRRFLNALKSIVVAQVIKSANVQHLEFKGQKMVVSVFETLESDPKSFLPADAYEMFDASNGDIRG
jgi:dGTPase